MWDVTKSKAFADDKLKVDKMMISLLDRVENSVGKGENAGYQHFLLFPQCFPKPTCLGSLKSGLFGKELKRVYSFPKDLSEINCFNYSNIEVVPSIRCIAKLFLMIHNELVLQKMFSPASEHFQYSCG